MEVRLDSSPDAHPPMTVRRRLAVLAVLATLVAVLMGVVTTQTLYRVALRNEGEALRAVVRTQARMLEAVFQDELGELGSADAALNGALAQFRAGRRDFGGFGASGEFSVARRRGAQVVFDMVLGRDTLFVPDPISWASDLAEPMRRALSGLSGVDRLLDYKGDQVLAAYTPVAGTPLGLVAKKNLAEVHAPYASAGLLAWGIGLGGLLAAAWVAGLLGRPLMEEVEVREEAHQAFLRHFPGVAFRATLTPDGVWRYESLEGSVRDLTGWPAEHFLSRPESWIELVVPEDRAGFAAVRRMEGGAGPKPFDHQYRIRTSEGAVRWIHTVVDIRDGAVYGLHYDITRQRKADDRLRARDAELTTLIRSLPGAAIHVLDRDLRFLFSAGSVLDDLGLHPEDLRGRHVDDVVDGDLAALARLVNRRVSQGETVHFSGAFQGRDFVFTAAPIGGSDGVAERTLVLATDVTEERRRDQALEESEARLRQVLEAGHHGVYNVDLVGGEGEVSPEYATMLGYDPETFVETSTSLRARIHPDELEQFDTLLEEYRAGTRKEHALEYRLLTKDGRWRWIRSTGAVSSWGRDGRPARIAGIHTDITPQKALEEALTERKRFLEAVLDHAPVMYCAFDSKLRLQYGNPAFEAFFGWSLDEARALPDFLAQVYPDPAELQRVRDFIRTGGGTWGEFRPIHRDGTVLDAAFANVVLEDGTSIGIGQDISRRKAAELSLMRREELFRSAVEGAPDGIFIDVGGRFVFVNRVAATLLGVSSPDEVVGRSILDFIHESDRDAVAAGIRAIREERRAASPAEFTLVRPDGTEVPCEFSAVPFSFDGEAAAMVFARDRTERTQAQATVLEQLDELRRWQNLMLDREDRVQELKREVNELCREVGAEIRYPSQGPAES